MQAMPQVMGMYGEGKGGGGRGGQGGGGGGATGHVIQPTSTAPRISFPHCSTCQHALTGGLWEIGELGNTMKKERLDPTSEINQSINQSINSILILISRAFTKMNTVLNLQIF